MKDDEMEVLRMLWVNHPGGQKRMKKRKNHPMLLRIPNQLAPALGPVWSVSVYLLELGGVGTKRSLGEK